MLRSSFFNKAFSTFKNRFVAHCEEQNSREEKDEVLDMIKKIDNTISPPEPFINISQDMTSDVQTFEGIRFIFMKTLNQNTAVNHFFWVGSPQMQSPFYQYRLFAPINDDNNMHLFTNTTLSRIDAELKSVITPTLISKVGVNISENGSEYTFNLTNSGKTSNISADYIHSSMANAVNLSYVQGVTPFLTLGGSVNVNLDLKNTTPSVPNFYGALHNNDTSLAVFFDGNFYSKFTKKVNPNRVHLTTGYNFNINSGSNTFGQVDYFLRQSKMHFYFDSALTCKSSLETNTSTGINLNLVAQLNIPEETHQFGITIAMG